MANINPLDAMICALTKMFYLTHIMNAGVCNKTSNTHT